jgi:hypothetical protein
MANGRKPTVAAHTEMPPRPDADPPVRGSARFFQVGRLPQSGAVRVVQDGAGAVPGAGHEV